MESPSTVNTAANPDEQPKRTDKQIWGIYIALFLISIVELYSASSHEVTVQNVFAPVVRHVMFLLIGLAIMLLLQRTHYKKFLKWSYLFAGISLVAMIYTLKFGDYINGARRSFSVGGFFAVQPAEMVKISAAFMIAAILSRSQVKGVADITNSGLVKSLIVMVVAIGLLITQGLTNTLLLMCISASMILIGGLKFKKFFIMMGIFGVLAFAAYGVKTLLGHSSQANNAITTQIQVPNTSYTVGIENQSKEVSHDRTGTWHNRMKRFMRPDKYNEEITDLNQQEQYSYIAQAHGGIFGVKPGNSRETARLPLAFSDYIYAIVIEEMGLAGGLVVLILYLWLLARAGRIANRCQTAYPALLVIGMAVYICYQAMFHMAIVSGFFPVSGQPLPLISKGGTSILITSVALGVMLSVSRFAARKGQKQEIREELQELPEEVTAANLA